MIPSVFVLEKSVLHQSKVEFNQKLIGTNKYACPEPMCLFRQLRSKKRQKSQGRPTWGGGGVKY